MVTKKDKPKKKRSRPSKKKKPNFNVLNFGFMKRVKSRWRKPRGTASKKRRKDKWAGALPKIGYKNTEKTRGLRRDGRMEILVRGMHDLEKIKEMKDADKAGILIKFSGSIGKKKRIEMAAVAKELGVDVINFKPR